MSELLQQGRLDKIFESVFLYLLSMSGKLMHKSFRFLLNIFSLKLHKVSCCICQTEMEDKILPGDSRSLFGTIYWKAMLSLLTQGVFCCQTTQHVVTTMRKSIKGGKQEQDQSWRQGWKNIFCVFTLKVFLLARYR